MKDKEALTLAIVMALLIVTMAFVVGHVFVQSLPTWCANPGGPGNHLVQSLCPVEGS